MRIGSEISGWGLEISQKSGLKTFNSALRTIDYGLKTPPYPRLFPADNANPG